MSVVASVLFISFGVFLLCVASFVFGYNTSKQFSVSQVWRCYASRARLGLERQHVQAIVSAIVGKPSKQCESPSWCNPVEVAVPARVGGKSSLKGKETVWCNSVSPSGRYQCSQRKNHEGDCLGGRPSDPDAQWRCRD